MKKRPFILLEILIACALLGLCAIPLMSKPIHLYKGELEGLRKMEKERLADLAFIEVKEALLRNEIPWNSLPAKRKKTSKISLSPATLEIPGYGPQLIEREVEFTFLGKRTGNQGESCFLLDVGIFFEYSAKTPYNYRLIAKHAKLQVESAP